jgi:hypothetical protein
MSRQLPLKAQYNTSLNVTLKDYLPIINNKIPSKVINTFDHTSDLTVSGGGTLQLDAKNAYQGKQCLTGSIPYGATWLYNWTPENGEVDLTALDNVTNNYANIKKGGIPGEAGTKDTLYFIYTMFWNYINYTGPAVIQMTFYSGTSYAITSAFQLQPSGSGSTKMQRTKQQVELNSSNTTYNLGFVDESWTNITKIAFSIYADSGSAGTYLNFWLHSMQLALPTADIVTNGYYPAQTASIYVSKLFGHDTIGNGTMATPFKTITRAVQNYTSGSPSIVILDSETYKENLTNLTNSQYCNLIANYLETPCISGESGISNKMRLGARKDWRTQYISSLVSSLPIVTVGKSGANYTSIQAAYSGQSITSILQIIDNGFYTETVTATRLGKAFYLEAAPQCTPTFQGRITTNQNGAIISGISFIGTSDGSAQNCITLSGSIEIELYDCSFSGLGLDNQDVACVSMSSTASVYCWNCYVAGNNDTATKAMYFISALSGSALMGFTDCQINLGINNTQIMLAFLDNGTAPTININSCSCFGGAASFFVETTYNSAAPTINIYGCDHTNSVKIGGTHILHYLNNMGHDAIFDTGTSLKDTSGLALANSMICFSYGYVQNSFFHDIAGHLDADGKITVAVVNSENPIGFTRGNIYYNINNALAEVFTNEGGNCYSINNIAVNCSVGFAIYKSPLNSGAINLICENITSNCDYGYASFGYGENWDYHTVISKYNCIEDADHDLIDDFGGNESQIWETGTTIADPQITNPAGFDFSWQPTSPIEGGTTYGIQRVQYEAPDVKTKIMGSVTTFFPNYPNLIKPIISKFNSYMFLSFKGQPGQTGLGTDYKIEQYNYFSGFDFAISDNNNVPNNQILNTQCLNNGYALRLRGTVTEKTLSSNCNVKNFVSENCAYGAVIDTAVNISYSNFINGSYGIYLPQMGVFSNALLAQNFIILKNIIAVGNANWDYLGQVITDYCAIQNRKYDSYAFFNLDGSLNTSNPLYLNTSGLHDVNKKAALDLITYFPQTLFTGYAENSPVWEAGSDSWQGIANSNIGAKSSPSLTATFYFDEYDFFYRGVADSKDKYYAEENPITVVQTTTPINAQATNTILGEYKSFPTAYAPSLLLSWPSSAKITVAGKNALNLILQTYWLVGLSLDFGTTWTWYKVKKDAFAISKPRFLFDDNSLDAYNNTKLELIQMPSGWSLSNYLLNNLGA